MVTVDPAVGWGRPMVRGSPTFAVAGAYWAGDSADDTAADFGLTRHELLVAFWFEATHGDYHAQWREWAEKVAYPRLAGWVKPLDADSLPLPPDKHGDCP